ncbi:MAG: TadE/TadG family type IV pilus assembly protein, partial [Acidimicrobiales bacterium]
KRRGGGGQATVELALALPLVALLLLVVVQLGLVVRDQVLVVHAGREAARRAAVDPSESATRQAALGAAPLDPGRLTVRISPAAGRGEQVLVRLSYRSPTFAPIIGPLLPDVVLHSRASMRREYD